MKSLFLSAALVACAIGANAQSISFIPQAGVNLANQRITRGNDKIASSTKAGIRAGVDVGLGFGDNLSIQPGIFLSQKGSSWEETLPIVGNLKSDVNINYLEIPVNVVYYFNNDQSGFFLNAGAYAAAALKGKYKYSGNAVTMMQQIDPNFKTEEDMTIGGNEGTATTAGDDIRRWDIGAQGGVGYQTKMGLMVRAQYILGATNIENHDNSKASTRNGAINIGLGWKFGR